MAKYGVNVPPGIPVFKAEDVKAAAEKMASPDGEVRAAQPLQLTRVLCGDGAVTTLQRSSQVQSVSVALPPCLQLQLPGIAHAPVRGRCSAAARR
jgi:hypothetical protein